MLFPGADEVSLGALLLAHATCTLLAFGPLSVPFPPLRSRSSRPACWRVSALTWWAAGGSGSRSIPLPLATGRLALSHSGSLDRPLLTSGPLGPAGLGLAWLRRAAGGQSQNCTFLNQVGVAARRECTSHTFSLRVISRQKNGRHHNYIDVHGALSRRAGQGRGTVAVERS